MAGTPRGRQAAAAAGLTTALAALCLAAGAGAAGAEPSLVPTPTPTPTVSVSGGVQAPGSSSEAGGPASSASGGGAETAAAADTAAAPTPAGDVLDQLAQEYAVGSGGGQLSNLLKLSLKLRAMGFKPSKANLAEIAQAMNYRPNQIPLIDALKDTIAYQQKIKAQMEILQQYQQRQGAANSAVMGAGQMPADSNPANLPGAPQAGAGAPAPVAPTP